MEDEQNLQDEDDIQSTLSDLQGTAPSSPRKKRFPIDAPVTSAPSGTAFGKIQYSEEERKFLQNTLEAKLTNDYIATRPGPGGQPVHYIETWRAIELANHTFGFNGWSSRVIEVTQDYLDPVNQGRWDCGVSALVQVQLKDGTFHEDIGYGTSENQKQKGAALEQAKKKAISDALKRALRNFGNALGLTVYDREHLVKIKKQKKSANVQVANRPTNPLFSGGDTTQQPPSSTTSSGVIILKEEIQSAPVNIVQQIPQQQQQQQQPLTIPKITTPISTNQPIVPNPQAKAPFSQSLQRNAMPPQSNSLSQPKPLINGPVNVMQANTNGGLKPANNGVQMNGNMQRNPQQNNTNNSMNNAIRQVPPRGPNNLVSNNNIGMKRNVSEMATSTGPTTSNTGSAVIATDSSDDTLSPEAKKLKLL